MHQSLNLAVIGLDISHPYTFAPALQREGVTIRYVYDREPKRARDYAERFSATVVGDTNEMPWDDIQGALITNIASEHAMVAIPFLKRGIPTFVDKQLAATFPDAQRIVETARRHNAPLLAGSVRRFAPAFRTIADQLKRGDLGQPVIVHRYEPHGIKPGDWQDRIETSGGFIVNFGLHCVDSICALLGSEVESVHCVGGRFLHADAASEDTCVITVQFRGGAVGIAEVFGAQQPCKATQPSLRVHGTKGTLEAFIDEGLARHYGGGPIYDPASYEFASGNNDTVAAFARMMRERKQLVPYDELLAVSRILAMARASYDKGRRVRCTDFSRLDRTDSD
jgi:myo-inositol 2-dehydrogenase/D-chiro-inositol 1-dehydrogenase